MASASLIGNPEGASRVVGVEDENTVALRPREQPDPAAAAAAAAAAAGAAAAGANAGAGAAPPPPFYLLLSNIGKATNVGKIVRSAIALGVAQIVVVGRRGVCLSDELVAHIAGGADGAGGEVGGRAPPPMLHLSSYAAAVAHFHALGARVCGIEIMPQAASLHASPFAGPTAFVLGNEGSGLSPPQIGACDDFVYIPQFGQGIASLNVSCAAAIVMYQFCAWAAGTAGTAAEMAAAGEGSLSGLAAGAAVEAQAGGGRS